MEKELEVKYIITHIWSSGDYGLVFHDNGLCEGEVICVPGSNSPEHEKY